jgi:hypothetical protein
MKIHKIFFVLIALIFLLPNVFVAKKCFADTEDGSTRIFLIYDELDNVLFEINKVEVGDIFITKDLKQYEVYEVDEENFSAYAEYSGYYIKPKITIEENKEKFEIAN